MHLALKRSSVGGGGLDFHVDVTLVPRATTLRVIAETVRRYGLQGKINCGHCCAFSNQDETYVEETLDILTETNISIVSRPMSNLYLQ